MTSFLDTTGRTWDWKFIPIDMPYSEWSMHKSASDRIAPFKRIFKNRVVVKCNIFHVMGTDEDELFLNTVGTTFATQTKPWRLEVDFWKSFVNIDRTFLTDLDSAWMV